MPLYDPAAELRNAPIGDIFNLLLTQFKRLMVERKVKISAHDIRHYADSVTKHALSPADAAPMIKVMDELISESEQELQQRFSFSFAQSLGTDMTDIDMWETTADFLELANIKSNAELRISAGSALMCLLGDYRYVHHLLTVIEQDPNITDVDAVIAKRALVHAARIEADAADWLSRVRKWHQSLRGS